jgi:anti-anti-sigma factor
MSSTEKRGKESMELKVIELAEDYTHLALIGKLDNLGVIEIEEQFLKAIEERKLGAVVDVAQVTFIGSNGLRMFLRAVRALHPLKKRVVLLNPQGMLKAVLLDSGIEQAVSLSNSLEAAIAKARA